MSILKRLEAQIGKWELQRLLGGEYDEGDAMLSIQVCFTHIHDPVATFTVVPVELLHDVAGSQANASLRWRLCSVHVQQRSDSHFSARLD